MSWTFVKVGFSTSGVSPNHARRHSVSGGGVVGAAGIGCGRFRPSSE